MENKSYVFNLETEKIELHFSKVEYDALSQQSKDSIKQNFIWAGRRKCWVSRCKEPNLYWAKQLAKSLGFIEEKRVGERLTFAEKVESVKERAEERANRFERYAENAESKAVEKQKPLNDFCGDIAFFTQPNINSASGRAFTKYREKLFARYEKGFEEYKKSDYFRERAETALTTARMEKFKDKGYLLRQIKECKKEIKKREEYIINLENKLYRIETGETLYRYDNSIIDVDSLKRAISDELELVDKAMDKQAFMENQLDIIGGVVFNRDNIKVGYIVKIKGHPAEVISTGSENVNVLTEHQCIITYSYAEVEEILRTTPKIKQAHPFEVGERFMVKRYDLLKSFGDKVPLHEYEIVKRTDKSAMLNNLTNPGEKQIVVRPKQLAYNTKKWVLYIHEECFEKIME